LFLIKVVFDKGFKHQKGFAYAEPFSLLHSISSAAVQSIVFCLDLRFTKNKIMQLQNIFIHHVFFWVKDSNSKDDLAALVNGLKKLSAAKTIRQYHIGVPATTNRSVIDNSYSVSWCLIFDNKDDEESYQVDPIHLNFVKECSHLWNKVVVYDSVDCK